LAFAPFWFMYAIAFFLLINGSFRVLRRLLYACCMRWHAFAARTVLLRAAVL